MTENSRNPEFALGSSFNERPLRLCCYRHETILARKGPAGGREHRRRGGSLDGEMQPASLSPQFLGHFVP